MQKITRKERQSLRAFLIPYSKFHIFALAFYDNEMVLKAFIQEYGNGKIEKEQSDLIDELSIRGIPSVLFTRKKIDRNQLALSPATLVFGDYDVVMRAVKYLGKTIPVLSCYPTCLHKFYKRKIWSSKIKNLFHQLQQGQDSAIFVKPKSDIKKFDGFVLSSPDQWYQFKGVSSSTEIFCSTVVEWRSEFRVYTVQHEVRAIKHYWGDATIPPDHDVICEAVQLLKNSGEGTAGYGLDVGVLSSGETAVIEWNDGMALGSYELDPAVYTDLVIARWEELMR